ncbi:hypothetical protein I302_106471 [Kwoniella bestiolae CBS 10118]|uniref:Uncharacterized protein n=1 Tax=Kwoniella bestiolae CBS 10118 TaxID=1296100 RepID=A0A1B9G1C5_9TREE|nr:hypothetical protein I302_06272 [Kwoniella bestiolae CBS 10118]OCF24811.1 hypothetical protein I302_06272 [Kwoniella bestiolae CBS 10118]
MADDNRHLSVDSISKANTHKSAVSNVLDLSFPREFAQMQGPIAPKKDNSYTSSDRSSTHENDLSSNTTRNSPSVSDADPHGSEQTHGHINPDADAHRQESSATSEAETRDDLAETLEDGDSRGLFGQWIRGFSGWTSNLSGPSATEPCGKNNEGSSARSLPLFRSSTIASSVKNKSAGGRRSISGMVREEVQKEKERVKQEQQKIDEKKRDYLSEID